MLRPESSPLEAQGEAQTFTHWWRATFTIRSTMILLWKIARENWIKERTSSRGCRYHGLTREDKQKISNTGGPDLLI